MPLEEAADLRFCEAVLRGFDGFADAVGDGVSGGEAEEAGGAFVAVLPDGHGCIEVGQADEITRVESGVESAEAEDLGLGAAGGGSVEAGAGLVIAQPRIVLGPPRGCFLIAAKKDGGTRDSPDGGVAELANRCGEFVHGRTSAIRQALGALDPGP